MTYYNNRIKQFYIVEPLHKKSLSLSLSFPWTISPVNVTKSAGNCGFGHITGETINGKLHFWCSDRHRIKTFFVKKIITEKNIYAPWTQRD